MLSFFFPAIRRRKKNPLFELVENTGVDFNNRVTDGKLENSFLFRNFYNGGGVAVGDINNDGLADIFFTSNMGDNKIYLNKGNFKFEDITKTFGYCRRIACGVPEWYLWISIMTDGWIFMFVIRVI